MRWMLIACMVLVGASAAAAEEPPGIIDEEVLRLLTEGSVEPSAYEEEEPGTGWSCSDGWHKDGVSCVMDEHPCGEGPHEIKFRETAACPRPPTPEPYRRSDGTYSRDITTTTLLACSKSHTETWTDWPECEGAERTPHFSGLPTVSEADEIQWMLVPRDPDEDRP